MSGMFKRTAVVACAAAVVAVPGFAQAASKAPTYPYAQATGLIGNSGDFKGAQGDTYTSPKKPGTNTRADLDGQETIPENPPPGKRLGAYTTFPSQASQDAADHRNEGPDGHKGALYVSSAKRNADMTVHSLVKGDFHLDANDAKGTEGDKPFAMYLGGVKNTADCNSGKDTTGKTTADALWIKQAKDGSIKKVALPTGNKESTYKNVGAGQNPRTDVDGDLESKYPNSASDLRLRRLTKSDLSGFKSEGADAMGGWIATIDDYGVDASGKRGDKIASHTVTLGQVLCTVPKDFKPSPVKEKVPTKIPAGGVPSTSQDAGPLIGAGSLFGVVGAAFAWRRRSAKRS